MGLNRQEKQLVRLFRDCTKEQRILILDAVDEMVLAQKVPPLDDTKATRSGYQDNVLPFKKKA